ncbi:hypothetical protein GY45DRAFT_1035659 [Cubamyces sp. BRFM 1775]|nr:hypothetical protein GY45DRAFT_1035659 [Cubamyces sp. BRFM 1775]
MLPATGPDLGKDEAAHVRPGAAHCGYIQPEARRRSRCPKPQKSRRSKAVSCIRWTELGSRCQCIARPNAGRPSPDSCSVRPVSTLTREPEAGHEGSRSCSLQNRQRGQSEQMTRVRGHPGPGHAHGGLYECTRARGMHGGERLSIVNTVYIHWLALVITAMASAWGLSIRPRDGLPHPAAACTSTVY